MRPRLERGQALLFEAGDLADGERPVGDVRERATAPRCEALGRGCTLADVPDFARRYRQLRAA